MGRQVETGKTAKPYLQHLTLATLRQPNGPKTLVANGHTIWTEPIAAKEPLEQQLTNCVLRVVCVFRCGIQALSVCGIRVYCVTRFTDYTRRLVSSNHLETD